MGVENNECILATTWNDEVVLTIKEFVAEIKDGRIRNLFAFVPSTVNGKITIILASCGSKKGWQEDKIHEDLRTNFINLLLTFDYEDGSGPINWVEVGYGEYGQKVLRGNCKNCYTDTEYFSE